MLSKIAEEHFPAEALEAKTQEVFEGGCPQCGVKRPVDVYSATRITGLLLAVQSQTAERLCCAGCGRRLKLGAFVHCLFLGWWSVRAFFFNLFLVPINLLSLLFTFEAQEPSEALRMRVKVMLGDAIIRDLAAGDEMPDPEPSE